MTSSRAETTSGRHKAIFLLIKATFSENEATSGRHMATFFLIKATSRLFKMASRFSSVISETTWVFILEGGKDPLLNK